MMQQSEATAARAGNEATSSARDALEARATLYETLAAFYFAPLSQEQIDAIATADFSACGDVNEDFRSGVNDMQGYLANMNSGTRQELAVDFTAAFAGTSSYEGKVAVPYKSVFTSADGLLMQEGYEEVFRAYKQEAVRRRAGFDWPEDHLSVMFQFMALMSRRACQALREDDRDRAVRDLRISQDFKSLHVDSWIDGFFGLAERILQTRFYRGVLRMTAGYLLFDEGMVEDLIDEISGEER